MILGRCTASLFSVLPAFLMVYVCIHSNECLTSMNIRWDLDITRGSGFTGLSGNAQGLWF
jgi:hypothetical protein